MSTSKPMKFSDTALFERLTYVEAKLVENRMSQTATVAAESRETVKMLAEALEASIEAMKLLAGNLGFAHAGLPFDVMPQDARLAFEKAEAALKAAGVQ